jgi:hypothetical protein
LFGFALGTGIFTATSSVGFFLVCAWLTTTPVAPAILVTLAFAAARSIPAVIVVLDSGGLTARSAAADRVAAVSGKWAPIERVALAMFAFIALVAS